MPFKKGKSGSDKHKWPKGVSGNPNGRPRKLLTLLQNEGYKIDQVRETLEKLMELTQSELLAISKWSEASALEQTVSKALYKATKSGDLRVIESLLGRLYGQPKQIIDHGGKIKTESKLKLSELPTKLLKQLQQHANKGGSRGSNETD